MRKQCPKSDSHGHPLELVSAPIFNVFSWNGKISKHFFLYLTHFILTQHLELEPKKEETRTHYMLLSQYASIRDTSDFHSWHGDIIESNRWFIWSGCKKQERNNLQVGIRSSGNLYAGELSIGTTLVLSACAEACAPRHARTPVCTRAQI